MALTGYIKVTTEELENQAAVAERELGQLETLFEDVNKKIQKISGYWSGQAHDKHTGDFLKKMQTVDEIMARYTEHISDLRIMAGVYERAEAEADAIADELPVSDL